MDPVSLQPITTVYTPPFLFALATAICSMGMIVLASKEGRVALLYFAMRNNQTARSPQLQFVSRCGTLGFTQLRKLY